MNNDSIFELLHKVEIFKNIPAELIKQLAGSLNTESYTEGSAIIRKGDEGDSMYIIIEGKVKIHDGEHIVAVTEAGNYFGEFSLLDSAPRSMSVTALTEVKTISISRDLFYNLFKNQPDVSQKIISTLTKRLRNQNESIS